MKVEVKDSKNPTLKIVYIFGEVDVYTSMELKKVLNELIENGKNKFVIDLKEVSYMDSSGLGILVHTLKKSRESKGNLKIINLSKNIKKIFELTRLTKFFEIFDNESDAVKSFE